jgi:formylglycine-generating enzyme
MTAVRTSRRVHAAALLPALLLALASACGPTSAVAPELLDPAKPKDAFDGMNCSAIRPPTEPDLMAWDPGQRLRLKQLGEQGAVGVRYKAEGCNVELEVLNCVGKGTPYSFSPYSATETKVAKSQRDLYTELPLGAARFGGKVGGGRALRTDYMLAGLLATPVMESFPAERLEGDCKRATHVVSQLYLGGFAMAAGESETIAAASLFGVEAGVGQDRSAERLQAEGNANACQKAQEESTRESGCSVPLRIGLTPIAGRVAGSCPTGSEWNGSECVTRQVVTQVECPAGTTLQNGKCVAELSTDCPAGTSFQAGQGCVASVSTSCPAGTSFVQGQGCVAKVVNPTATQPTPAKVDTTVASGSCPAGMAQTPGGSFTMGSQGHKTVAPFCMDLTEVTVAAYKACTSQGKCSSENVSTQYWDNQDMGRGACNWGVSGRDQHPMNCVDWGTAAAYCRAQGKRLPTEEEWEWAARGGPEGRNYPWGNAEPDFQACWSGMSQKSDTCPVGSHPDGRSAHGLQDMAGNVWEWTSSLHKSGDPARVNRGGGWDITLPPGLRASNRDWFAPASRDGALGFRCAR